MLGPFLQSLSVDERFHVSARDCNRLMVVLSASGAAVNLNHFRLILRGVLASSDENWHAFDHRFSSFFDTELQERVDVDAALADLRTLLAAPQAPSPAESDPESPQDAGATTPTIAPTDASKKKRKAKEPKPYLPKLELRDEPPPLHDLPDEAVNAWLDDVPPAEVDESAPTYFSMGMVCRERPPTLSDDVLRDAADTLGFFRSGTYSCRLDVPRSIKATLDQGGIPAPRFESRRELLTLALLVDRATDDLRWCTVPNEIAVGLRKHGVRVQLFSFYGIPDRFTHERGRTWDVEDLEEIRKRLIVLLVTDGAGMHRKCDRRSLERIARWPRVAMLDPRPPGLWDLSHRLAQQYRLPMHTCDGPGLIACLRRFSSEARAENGASRTNRDIGRQHRIVRRHFDGDDEFLRRFLGRSSLRFAQACAVPPAISLGLADHLRARFFDDVASSAYAELLALPGARLTWAGICFSNDLRDALLRGFEQRERDWQREIVDFLSRELEEAAKSLSVNSLGQLQARFHAQLVRGLVSDGQCSTAELVRIWRVPALCNSADVHVESILKRVQSPELRRIAEARIRPSRGLIPDHLRECFAAYDLDTSEARARLRALQEEFLAVDGPLDAEERRKLWPEMGALHAILGQSEDAGICWMNAIHWLDWPYSASRWKWFLSEAIALEPWRSPSWTNAAMSNPKRPREIEGSSLDVLLQLAWPSVSDVRAFAAYLTYATQGEQDPKAITERLPTIRRFLETHENALPIRARWLAWLSVAKLAGDNQSSPDARDRIFERLDHHGLQPDLDLPTLIRTATAAQRPRITKDGLLELCSLAQKWSRDNHYEKLGEEGRKATPAYIDLILSFAMARIGEIDVSVELQQGASEVLTRLGKTVHQYLLSAFEHRIKEARGNQRVDVSLSDELFQRIDEARPRLGRDLEKVERYALDRLRSRLKILEPEQIVDPYSPWTSLNNSVEKELSTITDTADADRIKAVVEELWSNAPQGANGDDERVTILKRALNVADRVPKSYAEMLLDRFRLLENPLRADDENRLELLEQAVRVAGRLSLTDHVRFVVECFEQLITATRGAPIAISKLTSLTHHCLRVLRRIGLRDEIERLLGTIRHAIQGGRDLALVNWNERKTGVDEIRALLEVAAGYLYLGKREEAEPIIGVAQRLVFSRKIDAKDLPKLVRAYAWAVGQLPWDEAEGRLIEILQRLNNVRDSWTTNAYYSQSHLDVVEAVVLAALGDDAASSDDLRRWLDEEERLIRERIERDVRNHRRGEGNLGLEQSAVPFDAKDS